MKKETIQNLIKELIEKLNINIVSFLINEDGENTWFTFEVSDPHFFISNNGEGLHALNHLVRLITDKSSAPTSDQVESKNNIFIDINGFQKKHIESVKAVAHLMSERARYFKSNVEVDPMSSFERRIVHEFLATASDLKTESIGFGPSRRVVIKYVGTL